MKKKTKEWLLSVLCFIAVVVICSLFLFCIVWELVAALKNIQI